MNQQQYSCKRCGYASSYKQNVINHLNRKKICQAANTSVDIDPDVLIKELMRAVKEEAHECKYCGKKFNCKSSVYRHHNTCDLAKQQVDMILAHEIQRIKNEISDIQTASQTPTTSTTYNIQNIIINVNNYGNEILDHLTPQYLTKCVLGLNSGFQSLLQHIHFNPSIPENRNVRLKSHKKNMLELFRDGQWVTCDKSATIEDLIGKSYKILYKHFIDSIEDPEFKEREEYLTTYFTNIGSKSGNMYYQLKRNLYIMVYNESLYVIETAE
jgi:hypothetical protein